MIFRTVVKEEGIFMTIWSTDRNFDQFDKILVALHGCPSHPFDHIPYNFDNFFKNGYIVVFPNYYGTWGSDGICNFNNCADTIIDLITILKNNFLTNQFDNSQINLQNKDITLMGASFGGYVALSAGAQSKHIKNIIAYSPIIDRDNHNIDNNEADLKKLSKEISNLYSNLRRCSEDGLLFLSQGKLIYNKNMMKEHLIKKNVLIIHGDNDPQVKSYRSQDFVNELKEIGEGHYEYVNIKDGGHILLHHTSHNNIGSIITEFIETT